MHTRIIRTRGVGDLLLELRGWMDGPKLTRFNTVLLQQLDKYSLDTTSTDGGTTSTPKVKVVDMLRQILVDTI